MCHRYHRDFRFDLFDSAEMEPFETHIMFKVPETIFNLYSCLLSEHNTGGWAYIMDVQSFAGVTSFIKICD